MIAAAHRVHKFNDASPSCKVCRRPSFSKDRARWGCDAPSAASKQVFTSTCTRCQGTQDECEICSGTGLRHWDRCPASQTDDWSMLVAETWENLQSEHSWPDGLPWGEQDNRFYTAVTLYGNEVNHIQMEQRAVK